MRNYYEELNLDSQLSADQLTEVLKKERKKWATRQNAPDMNARQRAEHQLELIGEAMKVLSDKKEKSKYDKELKKAMKKGNVAQTQSEAPAYQSGNQQGNAVNVLIALAEEAYNSGDSHAAINACQKALAGGVNNGQIYYILGLSYIEIGDMNTANSVFRDGITTNPDDLDLLASFTRILASVGNVNSATTYLNILKDRVPDHFLVSSTLIELELIKGNASEAEKLYNELAPKHSDDIRFKNEVSAAYLRYMNRMFEKGYFDNEAQLDELIDVANKRAAIDPDNGNEDVQFLNAKKSKKFDWKNIKGALVLYGFTFLLFASGESMLLSILALAISIAASYFNIKPVWKLERKQITGKKDPIDYIFVIAGAILAIIVFIFSIALAMFDNSND
ncbi:MAG TPA: DnaJ domain-containing protein [Clostridiales bacterium]|nr:DnaJ domain-containing protein [Clostridiales bacterium]